MVGTLQGLLFVRCALPLALLCLLLPALASAAGPVVLSGSAGGEAPSTAEVAGAAEAVLGRSDFQLAGDLRIAAGLDRAPVWVLGVPQAVCEGEPVSTVAFDQRVKQASDAVDSLEFAEARKHLGAARAAMPCLDDVAPLDSVYQVWFLEGLSAFHEGKEDEAQAAFEIATAMDPTRQWNDAYAPAPQGVFLAALQSALAKEGRALGRDDGVTGEILVDGQPFDGTGTLLAGTHLVQVRDDERTSGILLELPSGDGWLSMTTPASVATRAFKADNGVATLLAERFADKGWSDVLLVSELGATRFSVADAAFSGPPSAPSPDDKTPIASEPKTTTPRPAPAPGAVAGGVLAGVGAGVAGAGFTISGLAFDNGNKILADDADEAEYTAAFRENRAGFAMGIAGAVAAGTGLIVAIVSGANAGKGNSVAAQRRRALERRRAEAHALGGDVP